MIKSDKNDAVLHKLRMKSTYILQIFIATILFVSDGFAQSGTFDVYNYKAPEFFIKSELPSRLQFSMKINDTSFCIITLYKSWPAKADVMNDVTSQWKQKVAKRLNSADKKPAKIIAGQLWDGWVTTLAIGNYYQQKKKCVVMLYSFRKNKISACAVFEISNKIFKEPIEQFSKKFYVNN